MSRRSLLRLAGTLSAAGTLLAGQGARAAARPVVKHAAVSASRIGVDVGAKQVDQILPGQNPLRHRNREYRIVGEGRLGNEQREVLGLGSRPFMHRTDDVADDCT
jgi:hypothetical protein